jgi:hypothetical protein
MTGRLTSWRRLALGGEGSVQNALPAHAVCNPYRLNHRPGELRWIPKFGVWLRTQIAKETAVGNHAGQKFSEHEPGARNATSDVSTPRIPVRRTKHHRGDFITGASKC